MKRRTYLLTLVLFLLFFNGSILLMSVSNLNTSLSNTRSNCLREHDFIATSLAKDLNALESRGSAAETVLPSIFNSYVSYYGKQHVYLALSQADRTLYSSLPAGQQLTKAPPAPALGKRIISTVASQDRKYIVVSGALPLPFAHYAFSYYYDLSELIAAWRQMTSLLFLAGIAISSLLAVCLILLLNRIFKPLRQISETSQSIAGGDYGNRLPVKGNDELAEMAASFNHMAEAIEHQMARLSEAAEQKQRFIDNFAHELRTPLTSIYGYAEYIQKAAATEDDKLEATGYIMSESRRLQNIAGRLLDLASLRSGDIVFVPVRMDELLRNVAETMNGKAEEQQIDLSYEAAFAWLDGDRDLLQSLLINLADNACKACTPGGRVKIQALMRDGKKTISITDNGRGITEEQLSHITEAFYRVDKGRSRAEGGVGLGLSICEQIAALHNARLSFVSQPGAGTTATVTFYNSLTSR
ncbi:MAG TPA: HAMP domain-containing sensor histidine kinase [Syntrophomonas sp.]|nr:HAMP domain-containing sensor histidine kinase [Syntrophomonas sp.]